MAIQIISNILASILHTQGQENILTSNKIIFSHYTLACQYHFKCSDGQKNDISTQYLLPITYTG